MKIRNRNKCSVVPLLFLRRRYGDTFCKGKIRESVFGLDFQGDKTAQQRLKKPEKGVRILSPRFFIAMSREGPVAEKAVGSLLTNSFFDICMK